MFCVKCSLPACSLQQPARQACAQMTTLKCIRSQHFRQSYLPEAGLQDAAHDGHHAAHALPAQEAGQLGPRRRLPLAHHLLCTTMDLGSELVGYRPQSWRCGSSKMLST